MIRWLLPLLLATPAAAQQVGPCGDWAQAWAIVEPWEQHAAAYANGDIRIAHLDTAEPAAAPAHLLILSPPYDEAGQRQCRLVSLEAGDDDRAPSGFYDLDFPARKASYDPVKGLTLTLPAQTFVPDTGRGQPSTLTVTINQASGAITARLD